MKAMQIMLYFETIALNFCIFHTVALYIINSLMKPLYFQLIVMDLVTTQMAQIPSLKSSDHSLPADCPCGIHSISVNPSRTLLATGAENTNDLAVYKLPTFDPVCVGEVGVLCLNK